MAHGSGGMEKSKNIFSIFFLKKLQEKMCFLIESVIKIHICFFLPRLVFEKKNKQCIIVFFVSRRFVDGERARFIYTVVVVVVVVVFFRLLESSLLNAF